MGVVTGAGEALALVLRLPSGTRADRTGSYWPMTIAGYGLTAVCVPLLAVTPATDAWTRGMLVVDNARLGDVIAELARYRTGYLGVDKAVADLRITGSFPLHDTTLALNALLPTLPVQIEQHTPWWVTVKGKP